MPQPQHRFRIDFAGAEAAEFVQDAKLDLVNRTLEVRLYQGVTGESFRDVASCVDFNRSIRLEMLNDQGEANFGIDLFETTAIEHQMVVDYKSSEPVTHLIKFSFKWHRADG